MSCRSTSHRPSPHTWAASPSWNAATAPSTVVTPCAYEEYWRTLKQTSLEQSKMTDPTHDSASDTPGSTDADWAAALSEQAEQTRTSNQAEGLGLDSDDWASALAEQTAAQAASTLTPAPQPAADGAAGQVFQPLVDSAIEGNSDIDMIMDIPVQLRSEEHTSELQSR